LEKPVEKSWKNAIKRVLSDAQSPLHYSDISEQILVRGYYSTDGATPAATVSAQLSTSIKRDGDTSPFIRVGKGIYALRAMGNPAGTSSNKADAAAQTAASDDDAADALINSFGMYWQRDLVVWRSDPKMYGRQQTLSKPVNFGKQKGIYILYDHHTVVYVGRSIDRPLGKRLYEHTGDRLGSRWNRFSWFGLLDVADDGSLRETSFTSSLAVLVGTLEALLIEALEPPQNRKRGDDFSAIEYIQDIDPELKDRQIQDTLRSIEHKMRGGA
jgi:hypothetical protein